MASVICKQCGKTFEGYFTRQFCDECKKEHNRETVRRNLKNLRAEVRKKQAESNS